MLVVPTLVPVFGVELPQAVKPIMTTTMTKYRSSGNEWSKRIATEVKWYSSGPADNTAHTTFASW